MWHHRSERMRGSSSSTLNFLWQKEGRSLYVMDNHLAALWCWLRELTKEEPYVLLHVDQHWDSAGFDPISPAVVDGLSLEAFLAVRSPSPVCAHLPLVRWDNFIDPLPKLRRNLRAAFMVAWQSRDIWHGSHFQDRDGVQAVDAIAFLDDPGPTLDGAFSDATRVLVDLDLDVFVNGVRHDSMGYPTPLDRFPESTAKAMLAALASRVRPQDVVTIALSPECCGTWAKAEALLGWACEAFGVVMPPLEEP